MVKKTKTGTADPAPVTEGDGGIDVVLDGMTVAASVRAEVVAMAAQLASLKPLTPADRKALREYAAVSGVMAGIDRMISSAEVAGDANGYLKLVRSRIDHVTLLRGLMRDMKLSRMASVSATTESASKRKADQKSGSAWEGVL
jgi:hypothetical protein